MQQMQDQGQGQEEGGEEMMEIMILASFVLAVLSYDEPWRLFVLGFFTASVIPWAVNELREWYREYRWNNDK